MRRRGSRRGELLGALEGQRHRLRLRGLRRHYLGKWYGRLHRCETVLGVVKAPARSVLHGSPTLPWLLVIRNSPGLNGIFRRATSLHAPVQIGRAESSGINCRTFSTVGLCRVHGDGDS